MLNQTMNQNCDHKDTGTDMSFGSRRNRCLLAADFGVVIFAYGVFYRGGINADTLWHTIAPEQNMAAWTTNGRYLLWGLSRLLYQLFGFSAPEHFRPLFVMFLLVLVCCIWLLQQMFLPALYRALTDPLSWCGFVAATSLPFVNILFPEHFYFTECYLGFPFAYLFAVLGCFLATRNRMIPAILLFILTPMAYQTGSVLAMLILSAWLVVKHDGEISIRLLLEEVGAGIVIMGLAGLNLVSSNILVSLGLIDYQPKDLATDYITSIRYVGEHFVWLLRSGVGLLPPLFLPLLVSLLCVALILTGIFRASQNSAGRKIRRLVSVVLLLILQTFLVSLFSVLSGNGDFLPRVVFVFFAAQSLLILFAVYLNQPQQETGPKPEEPSSKETDQENAGTQMTGLRHIGLVSKAMLIYMIVQIFCIHMIAANRYVSNAEDIHIARQVLLAVEHYEQETGTRINSLAFSTDADSPSYYDDVRFTYSQINEKTWHMVPYSLVQYVARDERQFEKKEMPQDIYDTYFSGKNWDELNLAEQMVVIDDTAYICVF